MLRSLKVVGAITKKIREDRLGDVVSGFGILNEPYVDCNFNEYKDFMEQGLDIVRNNLGPDTAIFVSDLFSAPRFNDGDWWLDPKRYKNTFLDSHYYNLFDDPERNMTPQEHIAHVCDPVPGQNMLDCCWQDAPVRNSTPGQGVQRIVTEWSTAYDSMPGELLKVVLEGIRQTGVAPLWNRQLSQERKSFLRNFAKAQIVSFEQASIPGFNHGWFYWTLKMEGGAFAEWDFLRGVQEGWFPPILSPNLESESAYGSCLHILEQTNENWIDVVHPYPHGGEDSNAYWDPNGLSYTFDLEQNNTDASISVAIQKQSKSDGRGVTALAVALGFTLFLLMWRRARNSKRQWGYSPVEDVALGPLKV